jgi:hypothetical protein
VQGPGLLLLRLGANVESTVRVQYEYECSTHAYT